MSLAKISGPFRDYLTNRRTRHSGRDRLGGRDPESSGSSMTSFAFWVPGFAGTLSGSRLASRFAGLGRDDELLLQATKG